MNAAKNKSSWIDSTYGEDIETIIPPVHDPEINKNEGGGCFKCLFYLCGGCGGYKTGQLENTKGSFINRFKKWISIAQNKLNIVTTNDELQHIFNLLTRLYAHEENVIEEISKCRINPDFTNGLRIDLEYFVPEICSFYLRGKYEEQNELLSLMTEACSLSFFFSHRLYFFLKAVISTQSSSDVKTECLAAISEIQQTCEFQQEENLLYLANSRDLVSHIKNLRIDGLYPFFKREESSDEHLKVGSVDNNIIVIKERFLKIKSMIAEYNELGNKNDINKASMVTTPLAARDIILLPFTSSINNSKPFDESESSPMLKKIDERKINAYLSTPRFIKYLTDISELISNETNKKSALKRELRKLNQFLPASVYIPFCQDSLRNYAVLHIPPEEVIVFQTKSRAPFMITVELYRPDELSIAMRQSRSGRSNTIVK